MDNKGYFESPEFRELLKRYEQAGQNGACSYFGIDELCDLLAYYISQEMLPMASSVYNLAERLHPNSPELTKMRIKLSIENDEPELALALIQEIGYTDDLEIKLLHATTLFALKDIPEARDAAYDILESNTADHWIVCETLELLLDYGFAQEVMQIVEEKMHTHPRQRCYVEIKAECLVEMQYISEAVAIYNKLLDEDPYSVFYWEQLAHIYYMVNKYGKSLECFEYELAIANDIVYARMMQGYCYYFMHDYANAKSIFEELALKYHSSEMPRFYSGLCDYAMGNKEAALEHFKAAIELSAEGSISSMLARINRAIILHETGQEDAATGAISLALLMHPENLKQLTLTGNKLFELRDKENLSFREINIMDVKDWSHEECLFSLARHLLGEQLWHLAKSVLLYMRASSDDTSDIDACIAYAMHNMGEKEQMLKFVENAINGKSNLLFELFGLVYDATLSARQFIDKIK